MTMEKATTDMPDAAAEEAFAPPPQKMGYRCANNIFSYCSSEPVWGRPPDQLGPDQLGMEKYPGGGTCKLDPRTCGKFQTLRQQVGNRLAELKPVEGTHKPKRAKRGK